MGSWMSVMGGSFATSRLIPGLLSFAKAKISVHRNFWRKLFVSLWFLIRKGADEVDFIKESDRFQRPFLLFIFPFGITFVFCEVCWANCFSFSCTKYHPIPLHTVSKVDNNPWKPPHWTKILSTNDVFRNTWMYMHQSTVVKAWNLKITHLQGKIIFQTSTAMFHVNFLGSKNNPKTWAPLKDLVSVRVGLHICVS